MIYQIKHIDSYDCIILEWIGNFVFAEAATVCYFLVTLLKYLSKKIVFECLYRSRSREEYPRSRESLALLS